MSKFKYCLTFLFLFGCGPDHVQNVDISPPERGGAPQNAFNLDRCVDGQKATCEYSYTIDNSNGNTAIVYGYRVCTNGIYSSCMK